MRIMIVTDAWFPQVNGVVTTLDRVSLALKSRGHDVCVVTHQGMPTFALPSYPEVRLALVLPGAVDRQIEAFRPDHIHIATEGTLGWAARHYCLRQKLAFTTSFHSRFPEMIAERVPMPGINGLSYDVLRHFHQPASATLVPTQTVGKRLTSIGFRNISIWTRGVDRDFFYPRDDDIFSELPGPVYLCAGRVSVEKNLRTFLDVDLPGTKVIVGDGPQLQELRLAYPDVIFTGYLKGDALATAFSGADVFVFPSKSDTFGLVMLEALACGVPVAAFPVEGPIDVITSPKAGMLHDDLRTAMIGARDVTADDCLSYVESFTWERVTDIFEATLVLVESGDVQRFKLHESTTVSRH